LICNECWYGIDMRRLPLYSNKYIEVIKCHFRSIIQDNCETNALFIKICVYFYPYNVVLWPRYRSCCDLLTCHLFLLDSEGVTGGCRTINRHERLTQGWSHEIVKIRLLPEHLLVNWNWKAYLPVWETNRDLLNGSPSLQPLSY